MSEENAETGKISPNFVFMMMNILEKFKFNFCVVVKHVLKFSLIC